MGNLWKTDEQRPDCLYPKEELCWVMPEEERETCKSQPVVMEHQGLLLAHHSWRGLPLANSVFFSLLHPCCGHEGMAVIRNTRAQRQQQAEGTNSLGAGLVPHIPWL